MSLAKRRKPLGARCSFFRFTAGDGPRTILLRLRKRGRDREMGPQRAPHRVPAQAAHAPASRHDELTNGPRTGPM